MLRALPRFLVLILFVIQFTLVPSLANAATFNERFESILAPLRSNKVFSGSFVAQKNQNRFAASENLANEELKISNQLDTQFCIGSLTKQFVATAILKLEENGKLSTDDPLSKYIPEYPSKNLTDSHGLTVTLKHLLQHTSGIPDAYEQASIRKKLYLKPISFQEILDSIKNLKLKSNVGQKWEYSNTGYLLLGEVIRRQSHQTFSDFMSQMFFNPLHLERTQVDLPQNLNLAWPYLYDSHGTRLNFIQNYQIKEFHVSDVFTDGNIYSTVLDLETWIRALLAGKVITQASLDKMFTPSPIYPYGMGWNIHKDKQGRRFISHAGEWLGYQSQIVSFIDDNEFLIWTVNQEIEDKIYDNLLQQAFEALE